MYRISLIIGFVVVLVIIGLHRKAMKEAKPVKSAAVPAGKRGFGQILVWLIHAATLLCFLALGITGFYFSLFAGEPMSGFPLMLHATAAPVFAVCLVALAVVRVHGCRFDERDWNYLTRTFSWKGFDETAPRSSATVIWSKVFFWGMILLSLPVILSIALSMLPLFGTAGQKFLYHLHRYSTLLLVMNGALFGYLSMMAGRQSGK